MGSSAGYPGPERALALYEAAIEALESADRKGAKMPYTSVNGHMFSFLDEAGTMGLRLPEPMREEFMRVNASTPMIQHAQADTTREAVSLLQMFDVLHH